MLVLSGQHVQVQLIDCILAFRAKKNSCNTYLQIVNACNVLFIVISIHYGTTTITPAAVTC